MNTSLALKMALLLGMLAVVAVFAIVWRLLNVAVPQTAVTLNATSAVAAGTTQPEAVASKTVVASATVASVMGVANAYPNVHIGIGLNSPVEGVLRRGQSAEVIGRSSDNVWLKIKYAQASSGVGWVSADLITLSSPETAIPVATPP